MNKFPSTESVEQAAKPRSTRPPLKPMNFYLLAVAVCPDCSFEGLVKINKHGLVFHECNEGNVSAKVPTLELKQERVARKLLR